MRVDGKGKVGVGWRVVRPQFKPAWGKIVLLFSFIQHDGLCQ